MSKKFNIHDWQAKQAKQHLNEHHGGDFPELSPKQSEYLDKLKDTDPAGYKAVEDYIKAMDGMNEMNSLTSSGGGTTFKAGNSMDVAVPNAFGDDKEKKMKAYKSIGYKKA